MKKQNNQTEIDKLQKIVFFLLSSVSFQSNFDIQVNTFQILFLLETFIVFYFGNEDPNNTQEVAFSNKSNSLRVVLQTNNEARPSTTNCCFEGICDAILQPDQRDCSF
jgi:hypothetical protein